MRWMGHAECKEEMRNEHKILLKKLQEKRFLRGHENRWGIIL
jgi:hypothetical protein